MRKIQHSNPKIRRQLKSYIAYLDKKKIELPDY